MTLKKISKAIRAFLAFLMLVGNPAPFLAILGSTPVRLGLSAFFGSMLFSTQALARTVARKAHLTPDPSKLVQVDMRKIDLGDNPKDEDFLKLSLFEELLVPTSGLVQTGENEALAKALQDSVADPADDTLDHLQAFVNEHPSSRWVLAAETNRGLVLSLRGYYGKALETFKAGWEAGKQEEGKTDISLAAKKIADRALSEILRIDCRVGRKDETAKYLKEMYGRGPMGIAGRNTEDAKVALAMMKMDPGKAYLCGPYALKRILDYQKSPKANDNLITSSKSSEQGFSLDQVWKLSKALGMGLQVAKRQPGAKVLYPSVVNWKLGHYAALVEEKNGSIHSQDPTFGNESWFSSKVLDEESSGYFLVAEGDLPEGWEKVGEEEASKVWGKGFDGFPKWKPPCNMPSSDNDCDSCGMPQSNIDLAQLAIMLKDTPLEYNPGVGSKMSFTLNYHQRATMPKSNTSFGANWSFNWLGMIFYSGGVYTLAAPGGGLEDFTPLTTSTPIGASTGSATTGFTQYSNSQITQTASNDSSGGQGAGLSSSLTRLMPDGTRQIYGRTVYTLGLFYLLMSQVIDPLGNVTNLNYDSYNRLDSIIDPLGRKTSFFYGPIPSSDMYHVTSIVDPFGRLAQFTYDAAGTLHSITDMYGLTSSFTYNSDPTKMPIFIGNHASSEGLSPSNEGPGEESADPIKVGAQEAASSAPPSPFNPNLSSDWVTSMTTPYGTTTFDLKDNGGNPYHGIGIIDPMGGKQYAEFRIGIIFPETFTTKPTGMVCGDIIAGHILNTFYWDKKAMEDAPYSLTSATVYHWLTTNGSQQSNILSSMKKPLESRIWYEYAGLPNPNVANEDLGGNNPLPTAIGRILVDANGNQTQQVTHYAYNQLGNITSITDPKGRVTINTYDTNGVDLLSVQDGNGDILKAYGNYNNHLPGTYTDAAGQQWSYQYNSLGQVTSITPPMGDSTQYQYDNNSGFLQAIIPPQPGSTVTYVPDALNRVGSRTDAVNGTLTYHYDNGDRLAETDYPDSTHEIYQYDRLDIQSFQDRNNRTTSYTYDGNRHRISVTDPMQQTTSYGWCNCGSLISITDPKGNKTRFDRDLESRIIQKTYADGSFFTYQYEPTGSRLATSTDPNKQTTQCLYDVDDTILNINYLNPQNPTPNVAFQYDPVVSRVTGATDGTGTTSYNYYSFGQIGGGKIQKAIQPVGNSTANVTYQYDADGRVVSRAIDGVAETYGYNPLTGQLTTIINPLSPSGAFTYTYDPASARLTQLNYPNGQQTQYDYFTTTQNSGRLKDITNLNPSSQILSKFTYGYDSIGEIKTLQQQLGTNTNIYSMGYDRHNQLAAVTLTSGTTGFDGLTISQAVSFTYDAAGNRTEEKTPSFVHDFATNNLNQLTNITPKPIPVKGMTSSPANVLINGQAVPEDASNNFSTTIPPAAGSSTPLNIQATSSNGEKVNKTNHVLNTQSFLYDANGNLLQDAEKKYIWDANDRLVKITYLENVSPSVADNIQMTYDGMGRRVSITESHGSTVMTTKTFVWINEHLCEERDGSGQTVKKRFYNGGEQVNGLNYYFTFDNLESVREMTDTNGNLHARYDYSPYGRQTKISGDLDSDFGFTDFYIERSASLDFTLYRVYDPEKGIWLSRDPVGEVLSLDLYEYVRNCPLNLVDPLGLMTMPVPDTPFPGFNWCGPGNRKDKNGVDLDPSTIADACCKAHDKCYAKANISAADNTGDDSNLDPQKKCDRAACDKAMCHCTLLVYPVTRLIGGIYYTVWNVALAGWSCVSQPIFHPPPKKCPCR